MLKMNPIWLLKYEKSELFFTLKEHLYSITVCVCDNKQFFMHHF